MWEFPSIQAFISNNGTIILAMFFGLIISAVCWINFYLSITRPAKESDKESDMDFIKNIAIGLFGFAFLLLTFWSLVTNYRETSGCRKLDLNEVKSARIRKTSYENNFTGSTLRYEDSNKLRDALKSLRTAGSVNRRKIDGSSEIFTLGYQVQLILEDDSAGPTINYFYENDRSRQLNVVIPQCTAPSSDIKSNDDIYDSTMFGNWIRDEIVPRFKNIQ